ncbi:MAG: hypothetical protein O6942_02295 [Bacteroidetes bacterium]|nr:hypothetical protein [Bacteroidota bacterium]MCZ6758161.1 hypothetical protein [Bacteroidota bacterium]
MDSYYFVIGVTVIGFFALAAALLVPVYFFLKKEERVAENWTDETIADANSTISEESVSDATLPSKSKVS